MTINPISARPQKSQVPSIVLIGPPGVGKTTIGRAIAEQLGLSFVDTDNLIADDSGMSIPAIFEQFGEAEFRILEANAVKNAVRGAGVVALGGGAVVTETTRNLLKDFQQSGGKVVFLDVTKDEVKTRLNQDGDRPLLVGGDAIEKWQRLYDSRVGTYKDLSNMHIDTSKSDPTQIASAITKVLHNDDAYQKPTTKTNPTESIIRVAVAEPYDVVIGQGVSHLLPDHLGKEVIKVLAIYPEPLAHLASPIIKNLKAAGYQVVNQPVPDAEAQKTWQVAAKCWETAGQAAVTRSDAVVAIGGGATTDLGGFVAATWLRGVKVIQVPTSLLAMVDAAIGGKTGINTPQGKNLVGAFHQPQAVLCDLAMLKTLPARDFTAGLAEVIKCGFISDPAILDLITQHAPAFTPWRGAATDDKTWAVVAELIQRAIAVKARVTADDPTEQGQREILNYGHTLGHAIEHHQDFTWRHGEAISVGMVFMAELAGLLGLLSDDAVAQHRALLASVGLPITYDAATLAELLPAMQRDKKARGAHLRFIALDGIGNPIPLADPPHHLLQQAFNRLAPAITREPLWPLAE